MNNETDNYVFVFDGQKWNTVDKTSFFNEIYEKKSILLHKKFYELYSELGHKGSNYENNLESENGFSNRKHLEILELKNILYKFRNNINNTTICDNHI